jgi:hypothetical protein
MRREQIRLGTKEQKRAFVLNQLPLIAAGAAIATPTFARTWRRVLG